MLRFILSVYLLLFGFSQSFCGPVEYGDHGSQHSNRISEKGKRLREIKHRSSVTQTPPLFASAAFSPPNEKNLCLTKGCIKAANSILQSINPNVKPCDDFYEYACGNWMKQNVIPSIQNTYSHFIVAYEEMQVQLKNVLEDTKDSNFLPFTIAREIYQACLNQSAIQALGRQPLVEFLYELVNGWPVLIGSRWDDYRFDWITAVADLSHYLPQTIIQYDVRPDPKNTSQYILNLDQYLPNVLVRDYYIEEKFAIQRTAYLNLMRNIFKLLNFGKISNYQDTQLREILEFEIKVVKITSPLELRRDENRQYHKMTVEELQDKYETQIDFRSFFDRVSPNPDSIKDSDIVKVSEPEYFENLGKLIKETPKRTIANFLGWQFVLVSISLMPESYLEAVQNFKEVVLGITANAEKWRQCVDSTNELVPEAVGKMYVDNYFPMESKKELYGTIVNVRKAFREMLLHLDWMDISTKKLALAKLKAVTAKIGFPNLFAFPKKLEEKFQGLNIYPDKHFSNFLNIMKHFRQYEINFLHKPVNKLRWYTKTVDINAFYFSLDNSIIFPAAFLKPPFFDIDRPRAMDYGSIGVVIGHELTHGFDDQGKRFDKNGNLRQWWSANSERKFEEKTQCLIDQYGSYYVPEVNLQLNGINTQGENIADNAGIKQAYMAYKSYESRNGNGLFLPGVNVTHEQLFFLSFGQTWCSINRPEKLVNDILADNHSPNKFRVNGVLSNFKEFFEAFQCPTSSALYREKRCGVF